MADIGCDHAYLPIHLIRNNIASAVIACDINKGPCDLARDNIRHHGLSERIDVVQTDGLQGIDGFAPDNIIICGMGADLICRIISDSEYTRTNKPLLILQAMTRVPMLRSRLLSSGYNITDEALVYDDRLYEVITARFSGETRHWNDIELLVGKYNIEKTPPLFAEHINKLLQQYTSILEGKKKAGINTDKEKIIIKQLEELKK